LKGYISIIDHKMPHFGWKIIQTRKNFYFIIRNVDLV